MHNPFVNDTFIVSLFLCCACVREREKARNFIERKNKSFFESSSLPIIHMQNNSLARNERLTVPVAKCYVRHTIDGLQPCALRLQSKQEKV